MKTKLFFLLTLLFLSLSGINTAAAQADFEQVKKNYYETHPGKGSHAEFWEPIPIQKYWNPKDFYSPPKTIQGEFSQEDCVGCHQSTTPGAFHAWKKACIAI